MPVTRRQGQGQVPSYRDARSRQVRASLALLAWWAWQEQRRRAPSALSTAEQDRAFLTVCPTLYEPDEFAVLDGRTQLALLHWTENAVRRIAAVSGKLRAEYSEAFVARVWRETLRDAVLVGVPDRFIQWCNA